MLNPAFEETTVRNERLDSAFDPNRAYSQSKKITNESGINSAYAKSIDGLLRIVLMIFTLGGFITACFIRFPSESFVQSSYDLKAAYLVFEIVSLITLMLIYFANFLNIIYKDKFVRIHWKIVFSVNDGIWFVSLFILSICCSVHAAKFSSNDLYYRKALFGLSSAFGFFASLLYAILILTAIIIPMIRSKT